MKRFTIRQAAILDFIRQHIATVGYPPTLRELCAFFQWRSPQAAQNHLRALEKKGAVQRDAGTARGLRLAN